jgi:hypothetical protein
MENLSFATPGGQVAGMHTDQVLAAARTIGRLQGSYWNMLEASPREEPESCGPAVRPPCGSAMAPTSGVRTCVDAEPGLERCPPE